MAPRVFSAILFYPRGGSAQMARALADGLRASGCEVRLLAGSRGELHGSGDAVRFYGQVQPVEFDRALASAAPLRFEGPLGTAPMHPSFEDRPGAPDAVFASLDDLDFERQVRAWAREFEHAGAAEYDVALVHHLTPLHEALSRVAPDVPVITVLHGTELLMLERIAAGAPPGWTHAQRWAERLRGWAAGSAAVLVTPSSVDRAASLLGLARDKLVPVAGGVDLATFAPREIDRRRFWPEVLSESPRGWLPGGEPGSVHYDADAAAELSTAVVVLSVGRFTAVKRLDRLFAAFAAARARTQVPAKLVIVGGHPGEWEGEHPAQLAARLGVSDVYLAGWHEHHRLPDFFAAGDLLVSSSAREQFGLVLVEAMACGLPVVATRSPGAELILAEGRGGWLVDAENEEALAGALTEAIDDARQRRERGAAALVMARERFSWQAISRRLAGLVSELAADAHAAPAAQA